MHPTHLHVLTTRTRWTRWFPFRKTETFEKVCTCKEADGIAQKLRDLADAFGGPLEMWVSCDMRGRVER